jgi:hypothetical protein
MQVTMNTPSNLLNQRVDQIGVDLGGLPNGSAPLGAFGTRLGSTVQVPLLLQAQLVAMAFVPTGYVVG